MYIYYICVVWSTIVFSTAFIFQYINRLKVAFLKHERSGNTSDKNQNINTAGNREEVIKRHEKKRNRTLKKLQIIKNHVLSPVQIIYRVVSWISCRFHPTINLLKTPLPLSLGMHSKEFSKRLRKDCLQRHVSRM